MNDFVAKWSQLEPSFVEYFTTHYAHRKEQWAVCYRDISIPDTTAHAEAFHNVLKE